MTETLLLPYKPRFEDSHAFRLRLRKDEIRFMVLCLEICKIDAQEYTRCIREHESCVHTLHKEWLKTANTDTFRAWKAEKAALACEIGKMNFYYVDSACDPLIRRLKAALEGGRLRSANRNFALKKLRLR
jgi:hypothetical protein